ncbi:MAG: hypothetical protein BWY91_02175 [bacterium ADurb.BinA028]|nr:MAG: hypothetical protein BWY91_02175 [bacterium ADurb.BinA028]
MHGDAHVRRQGPRGRRPDEGQLAGLEPVADGDRRVLTHLVDVVVHPQLVVGQRGLVVPAVGQDPEAFVGQALLVQLLEGPDHRLHVVGVESLVVVFEVDPPGLAGDVLLPLLRVAQHRVAAGVVEGGDPQVGDLLRGLEPQLALRLKLGGQPVGVPPEAALDPTAPHRAVARDEVLDVAGQQVPVVRQAVGEGRAVVEDELVGPVGAAVARLDAREERPVLGPIGQDPLLDRRESGGRGHARCLGVGARLGVDHWSACLVSRSGMPVARLLRATRTTLPDHGDHVDHHRSCRGTTSLVVCRPRTARVSPGGEHAAYDRSCRSGCDGPPVRFY